MLNFLFSPSGRIGRAQWWGVQVIVILAICFSVVPLFSRTSAELDEFLLSSWPAYCAALVLVFWINLCAVIKRYHDRGKSGWWYLIAFVPTIGGIWQFIECGFFSGEPNDNQYGPAGGGGFSAEQNSLEPMPDNGGLPNRYDRAIEEAVLANRKATTSETVATYQQPSPGLQSSNNRPVFGKRV